MRKSEWTIFSPLLINIEFAYIGRNKSCLVQRRCSDLSAEMLSLAAIPMRSLQRRQKGHPSRIFHSSRASCVWIMFNDWLSGRSKLIAALANVYVVNTPITAGCHCELTNSRGGRNALPSLQELVAPAYTVPGPIQ